MELLRAFGQGWKWCHKAAPSAKPVAMTPLKPGAPHIDESSRDLRSQKSSYDKMPATANNHATSWRNIEMPSDGFLHKYFLSNSHKQLHKWMHYFDIYERHLKRFQGTSPVMLEIGVSGGGSLAMWKEYLGPGAKIIGIDIDPACKAHEAESIEVFIGSQDDPALIEQVLQKHPRLDVVLDDGSHMMTHMVRSFELLYGHVAPRGVYIVEDTHTCYWPEYEGGLKRPGSFVEFVKDRLDDINAVHAREALPVSSFTRTTDAICCYDSVVVFERRPQGVRQAPITKAM